MTRCVTLYTFNWNKTVFVIVFINLEAFAPCFVYFRCVAGTAPGPLRVWQFESAADATVYAQTPQCSNRELCFRKREASVHGFLLLQ